jgi:hypothetical protein
MVILISAKMTKLRVFIETRHILRNRALAVCGLIVLTLSVGSQSGQAQQDQILRKPSRTIPTLDGLPHIPLLRGEFLTWCGDRAVMRVDGGLEVHDAASKPFTLSYLIGDGLECSSDGQKLTYDDREAHRVLRSDVFAGAIPQEIATYEKPEFLRRPILLFSHDSKSVVTTKPLTLPAGAASLNVILLNGEAASPIGWNRDSTEFFAVARSREASKDGLVEVFNIQLQLIGSGSLPKGSLWRGGWFANSQILYLYLGSEKDEFGVGYVLKCRIEDWKCERIASNVLEASVGGDGVLGIVQPVGKYSHNGEWETVPQRSVAEIRKGSRALARQVFEFKDRHSLKIAISPSGMKAVLTWFQRSDAGCPPESRKDDECKGAMLIDLSGALN